MRKAWPKKLAFAATVLLAGIAVADIALAAHRSRQVYASLKGRLRGIGPGLIGADAVLGYGPVPGGRGELLFPIGPDLPARLDRNGLRIPVDAPGDDAAAGPRPLVLALGCSCTFGDACLAEDAYPYQVARRLKGTALNAGGCGWGLAAMLLRGRELIPRHHPEVVVVQFSPWLAGRSMRLYGDTFFGAMPVPYFVETPEGIGIHSPVFASTVLDLPFDAFRKSPPGIADHVSFLARVAVPQLAHDDLHALALGARVRLGLVPPPSRDEIAVVRAVYGELGALARANGARTVVLALGGSPTEVALEALKAAGAELADGEAALNDRREDKSPDGYWRAYAHWRGSPPVMVDAHPNAAAHAILADAVVDALGRRP